MERIEVKVLRRPGLRLPEYATPGAAGMDIYASLPDGPVTLKPGERTLVPTGIAMQLPHGFECQIRPRSGLAINRGITVLNTPGTVDSDYRGEIKVILANLGSEPFVIADGERIAQMVIARYERVDWREVERLDETKRGDGAFGHTGL